MEKYQFYINAVTGEAFQPSKEQLNNEPLQILCVAGIEALMPPRMWVGPYNGEMVFYPSNFENVNGQNNLKITVGKAIIIDIINTSFHKYLFTFRINGQTKQEETSNYIIKLKELAEEK